MLPVLVDLKDVRRYQQDTNKGGPNCRCMFIFFCTYVCRKWYFWLLPSTREPPGNGMIYHLAPRLLNSPRYIQKASLIEVGYQNQKDANKSGKSEPLQSVVVENSNSKPNERRPTSNGGSHPARTFVSNRHASGAVNGLNGGGVHANGGSRPGAAPPINEANARIDERASLLVRVED